MLETLPTPNPNPNYMWETPNPNPNYVWETLISNPKDCRDLIGILKSLINLLLINTVNVSDSVELLFYLKT